MITHREIVHKIVQRNKGNLSFVEVNNVLLKLFKVIDKAIRKGEEISVFGLFYVLHSYESKIVIKREIQDKIIRAKQSGALRVRKYRSWTKECADEYCSKVVDEINLHNQTK